MMWHKKNILKMIYLNAASYHQPKKNLKDILRTWQLVFLVLCEILTKPLGYMYPGASEHVGMRACVITIPTSISKYLYSLQWSSSMNLITFFLSKDSKASPRLMEDFFVLKYRCSTDFTKGIETQNKEGQEGPLQVTSWSTQGSG